MKYELTDKTMQLGNRTLHRIKALKDFGNVKCGDIGGWVESEDNLSQEGECWIFDEARVFGNAKVLGNAKLYDHTCACNNAMLYGSAVITGHVWICNNAVLYGDSVIAGNATISSII